MRKRGTERKIHREVTDRESERESIGKEAREWRFIIERARQR